jgi:hypothetical protein
MVCDTKVVGVAFGAQLEMHSDTLGLQTEGAIENTLGVFRVPRPRKIDSASMVDVASIPWSDGGRVVGDPVLEVGPGFIEEVNWASTLENEGWSVDCAIIEILGDIMQTYGVTCSPGGICRCGRDVHIGRWSGSKVEWVVMNGSTSGPDAGLLKVASWTLVILKEEIRVSMLKVKAAGNDTAVADVVSSDVVGSIMKEAISFVATEDCEIFWEFPVELSTDASRLVKKTVMVIAVIRTRLKLAMAINGSGRCFQDAYRKLMHGMLHRITFYPWIQDIIEVQTEDPIYMQGLTDTMTWNPTHGRNVWWSTNKQKYVDND